MTTLPKKNGPTTEWTAETVRQHALMLAEGMRAVARTNYEEAVRLQKLADDVGNIVVKGADDFATQSEQLAAKIASSDKPLTPPATPLDKIVDKLERDIVAR